MNNKINNKNSLTYKKSKNFTKLKIKLLFTNFNI
jgi:hypothetical protein